MEEINKFIENNLDKSINELSNWSLSPVYLLKTMGLLSVQKW